MNEEMHGQERQKGASSESDSTVETRIQNEGVTGLTHLVEG